MREFRNVSSGKMTRMLLVLVFAFIGIMNCAQAQQDKTEKIREYIIQAQTADKDGDLLDALKEYKNALSLAPQYPELYKAIGSVYERLGGTVNLAEAITHYQRYLELASNADDSRAIQDKVYALKYLQRKSQEQDAIFDDLSGIWVAIDNIAVKKDKKTGQVSYMADFVFNITEIQKTGKYRVTILKDGSTYYSETIIDKTVNIIPQKDASFNFTIADAQVHTPNQGAYSGLRFLGNMLGAFTGMDWLGQAANVAVDIAQSNDLPSNTQTAYIFALRYIDGKLEGLVNVVQKFANPNQQRTLENGLHAITFVKKNDNYINEINKSIENKPDILYPIFNKAGLPTEKHADKYGNKLSKKDIINKLTTFNPELGKKYKRAKNLETAGAILFVIVPIGEPMFLVGNNRAGKVIKEYFNQINSLKTK